MGTLSLGEVTASATGGGGLGVREPNPVLDPALEVLTDLPGVEATNMAERGLLFHRGPATLAGGEPATFPAMGCFSSSYVNYDGGEVHQVGLHNNPLDIDALFDARWLPRAGDFTPPGSGPGYADWAPAVGTRHASVAITAANLAAHPSTGVVLDANAGYYARTGSVTRPALVMDKNPITINPTGANIEAITVGLVATVYDGDWRYTDLISFRDTSTTDPDKAKLMCLRLEGDELRWWVRGRQVLYDILTPVGLSIDPAQRYVEHKPYIVVMSIDGSQHGPGTVGTAHLVVIDSHVQLSATVHFTNRVADQVLEKSIIIGRPGSTNYDSAPYGASTLGALARMDLFEMGINLNTAWDHGQCQALAAKYDSIYGVSL